MKKSLKFAVGATLACSQMVWAGAAKHFFVLIPPDMEEWMSSIPMISLDGGTTGKPMTAVTDMCGWYSYEFKDGVASDNVVLYRDDDVEREDMIGMNGNWETSASATPIPLDMLFELGTDSLFFVPDEEQKTNEDGFYFSAADVDGIEGICRYNLASIIYDTDASLHPAFSCYAEGGEGCQEGAQGVSATDALSAIQACTGVTSGIVESTLDPMTKKPKLTAAGKDCFLNETFFNQLFNYTSGVNEMTCYDMPFHRSGDGRWEFDSDNEIYPETKEQGGFYPVEYTGMTDKQIDAIVLMSDPSQTPVVKARAKRNAESPITYGPAMTALDPTEGIPLIDVACNGPGWTEGHDCGNLFADVATTRESLQDWYGLGKSDCVFGLDCESTSKRWFSKTPEAGRNQHFCFESHAKFTHKPNLRFTFRGSDDLWVYVAGKLAVDLGGTHIPAPAYVDLNNFTDAQGQPLVIGNQYDIDIFYCDRRTPSNSLLIKTNALMMQKTGIDIRATRNPKKQTETVYSICYTRSGDGSCAAALTGGEKESRYCGDDIINAGLNISYTLVMGNKISSPAVPGFEKVSTPGVYECGIDLSNIAAPKIDKDNVCLSVGEYTLFVTIEGKSKKLASFRTTGEVDVVYANGIAVDANGREIPGGKYTLHTSVMAGQLVPVYISSVAPADKGVEIFPEDAVGIQYTLSYDKVMKVYYKQVNSATGGEQFVKLSSGESRTIGASGIDTVYAMVDMDDLTSAIQSFKIGVTGRGNAMTINYYLPQITFIESIPKKGESAKSVKGQTPKADGSYNVNFVDSTYSLYLAVLKPNADGSYGICTDECDGLMVHSSVLSSPKLKIGEAVFENGYATVSVRALAEYKWSSDPEANNPANIVVEYNDYVQAVYSPMYFSKKGTTGVKRAAQSTMPIAVNNTQPTEFTVMDLQGGVVRSGYTTSAGAVVKNLTAGTYVVRVGSNIRRVNIR